MTLSVIFYPYHFVRAILSITFCPTPFCPYIILSVPFCPYHFVRAILSATILSGHRFYTQPLQTNTNSPYIQNCRSVYKLCFHCNENTIQDPRGTHFFTVELIILVP